MLRRVKSVITSGDPTARALAIRVLGCLADLGKTVQMCKTLFCKLFILLIDERLEVVLSF
jgi:hypothetical protein